MAIFNSYVKLPEGSWVNVNYSYPMTDPNGAARYGVPWIPSIYPHGFYGYGMWTNIAMENGYRNSGFSQL